MRAPLAPHRSPLSCHPVALILPLSSFRSHPPAPKRITHTHTPRCCLCTHNGGRLESLHKLFNLSTLVGSKHLGQSKEVSDPLPIAFTHRPRWVALRSTPTNDRRANLNLAAQVQRMETGTMPLPEEADEAIGMARGPRSPSVSAPSPPRFGVASDAGEGVASEAISSALREAAAERGAMQRTLGTLQADVGAIKGELGELKELMRSMASHA